MKTCDKCMKHDICGKREVFGAVGCVDDFQQKPQTNADKIRSMSDEELTKNIMSNIGCSCCEKMTGDCGLKKEISCKDWMMQWLQSEVSNGN